MTSQLGGLLKKYIHNILVSLDQLLSTLTGGDPDETISSRAGKWAETGNKFGIMLSRAINFVFGKTHCKDSIEADEGKDGLL